MLLAGESQAKIIDLLDYQGHRHPVGLGQDDGKRNLGVLLCGSGVGTFLFAPIANHLISVSTWQTSNLIFGAICLLCILCGATMRPLQLEVDSQAVTEEERKDLVRSRFLSKI